jgi:hypothetical protein
VIYFNPTAAAALRRLQPEFSELKTNVDTRFAIRSSPTARPEKSVDRFSAETGAEISEQGF